MPIIARGIDDLLIDAAKSALEVFSAEQAAMDPLVAFSVVRDMTLPPAQGSMPLVNIWLESLAPVNAGSSAKTAEQELARINFDCYARGLLADDAEFDDVAAWARLNYLKEQVKHGLYKLISVDFGLGAGVLARKKWPTWQTFVTDLRLPEESVVAGRWTIEVEYEWTPQDVEGVALDSIFVDSGRWSALYDYSL